MSVNIASRLSTGTAYLSDLITGIDQGEIKVPQFQRKFIWSEEQAMRLLDSIANNYPIGSLLFWKTPNKLATERDIGEFKLPKTDDITPTDYVLDGQQRLTAIYSCLGAAGKLEGFQASYDLVKENFVKTPPKYSGEIFPLRATYDTTSLLDFRSGLVSHPNGAILQKRLDSLLRVIIGYKLPVVTLKDLTVEEVCPIFERINSSGTRLSTYDLMVAATWRKDFDLNQETRKISDALEPKGFGDIDGDTILKCLSAIHFSNVKKEDILALRKLSKEDMDSLVEDTRKSLLKTVDFLSTEFGIYSWDFLPYEAYAVILSKIFSHTPSFSASELRRARQWFWRSSFNERYRGASDNFITKDLTAVVDFVKKDDRRTISLGTLPSEDILKTVVFRSNNSRSRAFILLLSGNNPRNITNGMVIDTKNALSEFNKKQFHHIFPKAWLRKNSIKDEENTIVNICILTASENNKISDTDPHNYIPYYLGELGTEADQMMSSNLLPPKDTLDYSNVSYQDFINARSHIIHTAMERLINGGSLFSK